MPQAVLCADERSHASLPMPQNLHSVTGARGESGDEPLLGASGHIRLRGRVRVLGHVPGTCQEAQGPSGSIGPRQVCEVQQRTFSMSDKLNITHVIMSDNNASWSIMHM